MDRGQKKKEEKRKMLKIRMSRQFEKIVIFCFPESFTEAVTTIKWFIRL